MQNVRSGAERIVTIFAIHRDTIAVNKVEERDHFGSQTRGEFGVVVIAAADAGVEMPPAAPTRSGSG